VILRAVRWAGLVATLLTLVACAPTSLFGTVAANPPTQSPELRDVRNWLDVHYRLNSSGDLSARIVAESGQQWVLYERVTRPRAGDYVLQFDGTIPGPGPNERTVLPSGEYQIVLEGNAAGQSQLVRIPATIRDSDTVRPEVTELAALPDRISPDFDARDDVAHLTFRLAKEARIAPFLDRELGEGRSERLWMGEELNALAGEQALVWDGLASGQPIKTGNYLLGVRARDMAGNVVERAVPLVIEQSGLPEASIVSARIGPRQIIRGDQICLDAIVRNTGTTVLRTDGPDPGYIYNSMDTYSSIEGHRFGEHAGYWRVGLNWAGGTDVSGATYPYRWGFGKDLQPGEEVTVHGCVNVHNEQDKLVYFAGLVQENIAIHSAGAGLVRIEISS
jgi:hypothetical protein